LPNVAIDALTAHVAADVAASDAVEPVAVRFLLSQYIATARDDLSAIVGAALGRALQQSETIATAAPAEWLLLYADACTWSDDARLRAAAARLLTAGGGHEADGIEAMLRGASALGDGARLASSVDDLERLIARAYEPGDGVASADPFVVASALLTGFDITGRLPYAMLAEELVQTSQRRGERHSDIESACRAAHVLCRLAALHADEDYLHAAVIARGADYRGDGARLLDAYAPHALETPRIAARYGFALAHLLALH